MRSLIAWWLARASARLRLRAITLSPVILNLAVSALKLPFDVTTTPTYQGMQAAWRIATDVATGRRRMGMLCSDFGFGKTHILRTSMSRANVSWAYCTRMIITPSSPSSGD